ncbi:MAG TPA: SAM-dependent methyltransferase [Gammaproteobacteria bacterium]
MRSTIRLCAAATLGLALARVVVAQDEYVVSADTPANVRRAVESDARSAEQRARDVNRKPAEVLTLIGLDEGDRVVEFASFGHYYTTILADAVGPSGHVYMVDMPWTDRFGGEAARAFDAAHDNATYTQVHYNEMTLPTDVDVATIVLFYHDLMREDPEETVDTADMNRRIYDALAPGGTYVVIDHHAEEGSGWREAMTLHRIDKQTVIDEVTAAGFELETDSDLLANPADDRTLNMRDPQIRGETDRFLLVFRKPQ